MEPDRNTTVKSPKLLRCIFRTNSWRSALARNVEKFQCFLLQAAETQNLPSLLLFWGIFLFIPYSCWILISLMNVHAPVGRCQYFLDYCGLSNVCRHPNAVCKAKDNEVVCTCPPLDKTCSPGINQCSTNPSICLDENAECIELHDELPLWNMEVCREIFSTLKNKYLQWC